MSRGGLKISRTNFGETGTGDRVDWLDSFAQKVNQIGKNSQNAVEAARSRDHSNFNDQINSIISRQFKPRTVEEVVNHYQDKIGLKEWLRRSAAAEAAMKTGEGLPENFNKFSPALIEDIKNFVRNKIETHHGNIQVPAVVEEVVHTFRQSGISPQDVNEPGFEKFISDCIVAAKKNNPLANEHNVNLGRGVGIDSNNIDSANYDMFEGLSPAKIT